MFICGTGGRIKLGGTNTIVGVGIDPKTVNQNGDYRLFVADGIRTVCQWYADSEKVVLRFCCC